MWKRVGPSTRRGCPGDHELRKLDEMEGAENFPVIHYSQRLPFRRACATHDPRDIPSGLTALLFSTSIVRFNETSCLFTALDWASQYVFGNNSDANVTQKKERVLSYESS